MRLGPEALLVRLADGRALSGEALAAEFGVTRAAIWKQIRKLERFGVVVEAERARGYRLARPIDLLDAAAIRACWPAGCEPPVRRLDVVAVTASTNHMLLERHAPPPGRVDVCVAEFQTAGRGRHGRRWTAPFGAALNLSAAWHFTEPPPDLPALTLAIGVAASRALERAAAVRPALKWPNDLVFDERKLGGILVELDAEAHGPCRVVAGIGVNVAMPDVQLAAVSDWPRGAVDLATAARPAAAPSRSTLAAVLVEELARTFAIYADAGFAAFADEWRRRDFLRDRPVRVGAAGARVEGTARGIDADGALRLELEDGSRRRIVSGDVSVRIAS